MEEIWKPIPGYPGYEVSDLGRVRSFRGKQPNPKGRILKQANNKDGYPQVGLYTNKHDQYQRRVHRLMLLAFFGPAEHLVCNHINGIKTDNRLSNLEYVTPEYNSTLAAKAGLYRHGRGEAASYVKLTNEQVLEIRARALIGENQTQIGKDFGIGQSHVSNIKNRKIWSHI